MKQVLYILISALAIAQTNPPTPRHLEGACYDPTRNTLVVYGGALFANGKLTYFQETNEFKKRKGWTTYNLPGPGERAGASMVYDTNRKSVLLIGGVAESGALKIWFDLWAWDGKNWKVVNESVPAKEPRAAYDPSEKRLLVFGDASDKTKLSYGDDRKFELWEFRNSEWKKLSDNCPKPEGSFEVSFDEVTGDFYLPVWKEGKLTMWAWNKSTWSGHSFEGKFPAPRESYDFIYSAKDKAHYLYGGKGVNDAFMGDLWKFANGKWVEITFKEGPKARATANLVATDVGLMVFGGAVNVDGKTELSNEVWEYKSNSWVRLE